MTFFPAGSNTSATTVEWAMVELLKNQMWWKEHKLKSERHFMIKGMSPNQASANDNSFRQLSKKPRGWNIHFPYYLQGKAGSLVKSMDTKFQPSRESSLTCGQLSEIQRNGLKLRSFILRDLWIQQWITWAMTFNFCHLVLEEGYALAYYLA